MFPKDTLILIADDSPVILATVSKELRALGYNNIIEAQDGKLALIRLTNAHQKSTPVGLVISDWNMPNMKGIELLKKVRATPHWANLPFILLTTESAMNEVVEAVTSDVSSYMVKPLDPKILKEKLQVVWDKHNKK